MVKRAARDDDAGFSPDARALLREVALRGQTAVRLDADMETALLRSIVDATVGIFRAEAGPIPKMYVSATTTRLSAGRSTPAIRATVFLLLLPLLVARVPAADHPDDALAPDHLAVLTDLLHGRANLHLTSPRRERRSLGPTRDQDSATCSGR